MLAGEQSSGTFVRVAGESDELQARMPRRRSTELERAGAAARTEPAERAAANAGTSPGPWRRARVVVSFPIANIGHNLPTLAATVAGNLYDLGETTGVRLELLRIPAEFRARFERPRQGVAGTRSADRRGRGRR